jgi:membrane protease YdiL (CAAX protease family)
LGNIRRIPLVAMTLMAVLSFTNLFGLNIAGAAVFIGVAFFFINKVTERSDPRHSGLEIKTIGSGLKDRHIWLWIALPLLMDFVSAGISKFVFPEYIQYELTRAGAFVSFDAVILLVVQLAVLALGEEIAWRAFFQRQLGKDLPVMPVLLISSVLFALGHWTVLTGASTALVIYSVFFVFVNSVLYGVLFHKTNNAWISWISHFAANLLSIIFLPFFA